MVFQRFYSEVGKLMYSIAYADGKVNKSEYNKLREIVKQKLVPREENTDQFGTDAAYYAEIEFDILMDQMPPPESCFNSFLNYVKEHHSAFDQLHKTMVMEFLKEIASVYQGSHPKETELLKKLKKQLTAIFEEK